MVVIFCFLSITFLCSDILAYFQSFNSLIATSYTWRRGMPINHVNLQINIQFVKENCLYFSINSMFHKKTPLGLLPKIGSLNDNFTPSTTLSFSKHLDTEPKYI